MYVRFHTIRTELNRSGEKNKNNPKKMEYMLQDNNSVHLFSWNVDYQISQIDAGVEINFRHMSESSLVFRSKYFEFRHSNIDTIFFQKQNDFQFIYTHPHTRFVFRSNWNTEMNTYWLIKFYDYYVQTNDQFTVGTFWCKFKTTVHLCISFSCLDFSSLIFRWLFHSTLSTNYRCVVN